MHERHTLSQTETVAALYRLAYHIDEQIETRWAKKHMRQRFLLMTAGDTPRALIEPGGSISLVCWDGIPGAVIAAACAIACAAEAETMKSHEVLTPSPSSLRDEGDASRLCPPSQ